ncbi:hypothetical protein [Streptomyces sp. NPDC046161]|uniref:hypothetical protein n=1 Tax=Streptomyces sp. NPDC046161 TaxID=3155132 RepID=UPI0033E2F162
MTARSLISCGLATPTPSDGERPEQLTRTPSGWHCAALNMKVTQQIAPVFHQYVQPWAPAPRACTSPRLSAYDLSSPAVYG